MLLRAVKALDSLGVPPSKVRPGLWQEVLYTLGYFFFPVARFSSVSSHPQTTRPCLMEIRHKDNPRWQERVPSHISSQLSQGTLDKREAEMVAKRSSMDLPKPILEFEPCSSSRAVIDNRKIPESRPNKTKRCFLYRASCKGSTRSFQGCSRWR